MNARPILPALLLLLACGGPPPPRPDDPFEAARREIEEARNLPVPAGNYRIALERIWVREAEWSSIRGEAAVVVRRGADPGFRFSLSASLDRVRASERTESFVLAAPGASAWLDVGRMQYGVPVRLGPRRGVLIVPEGRFVGTSLAAVVVPAGAGTVDVEISPRYTRAAPDGSDLVVTEMATTVRVPLGAPLAVAADDREEDSVAVSILSRTSNSVREKGILVLTVTGG